MEDQTAMATGAAKTLDSPVLVEPYQVVGSHPGAGDGSGSSRERTGPAWSDLAGPVLALGMMLHGMAFGISIGWERAEQSVEDRGGYRPETVERANKIIQQQRGA